MNQKKSLFVGLPLRRERRKQANLEGMVFVPQYNGREPEKTLSKRAQKAIKNEITYREKQRKRKSKI